MSHRPGTRKITLFCGSPERTKEDNTLHSQVDPVGKGTSTSPGGRCCPPSVLDPSGAQGLGAGEQEAGWGGPGRRGGVEGKVGWGGGDSIRGSQRCSNRTLASLLSQGSLVILFCGSRRLGDLERVGTPGGVPGR